MRRKQRILLAQRRGWNALIDWWARNRIRRVMVIEPEPWRHPWFCRPSWDAQGEEWTTGVVPGWCESPRGAPSPMVTTLARLARGSEAAADAEPDEEITAPLDESPRLRIPPDRWRALGTDAVGSTEVVPQELRELGVLPAPKVRETETGPVTELEGVVADRAQARLARACEVVLQHGREVVSLTPVEDERGIPTLQVDFAPPRPPHPRLVIRKEFPDNLADRDPGYLPAGGSVIADEGVDELRLATIYVVSPAGAPEGSVPDRTWTARVIHRVARNVAYEVSGPAKRVLEPLQFPWLGQTLGLGAGGMLIDSIADELRNRAAELDAILGEFRTTGRFVEF